MTASACTRRRFRVYNASVRGRQCLLPDQPWILLERGDGEDTTLKTAATHAELIDFLNELHRLEHLRDTM